ncbi:MAG: Tat pathway signal protein [Caulobacteraceae bacterium]
MQRRDLLSAAGLMGLTALAAAPAEASEERKKGGGASFVLIQNIQATIMRPNGRRGVITMENGIDVPDEAFRAIAAASIPRLRAAYSQTLQTFGASLAPAGVPNADYLVREMQRQTDAVLGRTGARFLVGTIMVN